MTSRFNRRQRAQLRRLESTARELSKSIAELQQHHPADELEALGLTAALLGASSAIADRFAGRAKDLLKQ